jgi:hypothetical protein
MKNRIASAPPRHRAVGDPTENPPSVTIELCPTEPLDVETVLGIGATLRAADRLHPGER